MFAVLYKVPIFHGKPDKEQSGPKAKKAYYC